MRSTQVTRYGGAQVTALQDCVLPQRDPIVTAKSVASLDRLCGGRFVFALIEGFSHFVASVTERSGDGTFWSARQGGKDGT